MKKEERIFKIKCELNWKYMNRENYLNALDTPQKVKNEMWYLLKRAEDKTNDDLTQAIIEMKIADVLKYKVVR